MRGARFLQVSEIKRGFRVLEITWLLASVSAGFSVS